MTEKVSEDKIEALRQFIKEFPAKEPYGDFALFKKALLTLIDHSDGLGKSVSLVVRSRKETVAFEHGSTYLYQPKYEGAGLRKYLVDHGYVGDFSCGSYQAGGKIVTYLCWLASGMPENIQYDDIPFSGGAEKELWIVPPSPRDLSIGIDIRRPRIGFQMYEDGVDRWTVEVPVDQADPVLMSLLEQFPNMVLKRHPLDPAGEEKIREFVADILRTNKEWNLYAREKLKRERPTASVSPAETEVSDLQTAIIREACEP